MIKYYIKYFYRGIILILSCTMLYYFINDLKLFLMLFAIIFLFVINYTKVRRLLTFKEKEALSLIKATKKTDIIINDCTESELLENIKFKLIDKSFNLDKDKDLLNQLIFKNNIYKKYLPILDIMYQHENEIIYFEKIIHTDINRVNSSMLRLINKADFYRTLYKYNSSHIHVVNINIFFYVVISNNVNDQFKEDLKNTYHVIDNIIAIPILIDLTENTATYFQINKFFEFFFATYNKQDRYWAYRRATIKNYNYLIKTLIK